LAYILKEISEGAQGSQELGALPVRELRACLAGICGNADFNIDFRSRSHSRNAGIAGAGAEKMPKISGAEIPHHMLSLMEASPFFTVLLHVLALVGLFSGAFFVGAALVFALAGGTVTAS
jgi:hypothetical protein